MDFFIEPRMDKKMLTPRTFRYAFFRFYKLEHLQISWSFRPLSLLPGQESRCRSPKGPGETLPAPHSSFPQRDAEAKG